MRPAKHQPTWFICVVMLYILGTGARSTLAENDWNQWLGGPARANAVKSNGPAPVATPVFEQRWRIPFGSGYSAVSVLDDSIASMMNDGESDYAVVLETRTGKERWRAKVGRRYAGHDGSIDGPLSTPGLDRDSVYAISPRGVLFCFDLDTGKTRWKKNLKSEFGAGEPHYGFATSPLLVSDKVIIQAGGKGLFGSGHLVALNRESGVTVWKVRNELNDYASPSAANFFGVRQIITQTPRRVIAVNEADGSLLWELPVEEAGSWTPMVLAPDRILVSSGNNCLMIRVEKTSDGIAAKVLWKSARLAGTINPLIHHDGTIFGNHNRRLTAIDAKDGSLRWVEKRDMFPLLLNDFLVLLADREGKLVVAKPVAEAFQMISEQTLYDVSKGTRVESPMAFADDVLYVRTDFALFAMQARQR